MTDKIPEFRLESSGTWPRNPMEVRWKELGRKQLVGHPKAFDGFRLTLTDGREISLIQLRQRFIYAYHLDPSLSHPAVIVSSAIAEAKNLASWGDALPLVIPPTLFVSDHPMQVSEDDPDLGERSGALTLPRVQTIAEFFSSTASKGSPEAWSSVIAIWFQDDFCDIPSEIQSQLATIEWDTFAYDWTS